MKDAARESDRRTSVKRYPARESSELHLKMLTPEQYGALQRLRDASAYLGGLDRQQIDRAYAMIGMSRRRWLAVWPILEPYFEWRGDRLVYPADLAPPDANVIEFSPYTTPERNRSQSGAST